MRKILYALIAASAAAGIMLPAAASAATPSIRNVTSDCHATAHCEGQNLASPELALAVASDSASTGTQVQVHTPAANREQDFLFLGPAAHVTMEWAPRGVASGLCVSEPNVAVGQGLVLRKCNGSDFQVWAPADFTTIHGLSFNAWVNKASGFAMSDPGSGAAGTQLVSRRVGTAMNEEWVAIA